MKLNIAPETFLKLKKAIKVLGFLFSLGFIGVAYVYWLGPEIRVNYTFKPTLCAVVYKKLEQQPNLQPRATNLLYRPSILVFYTVNGKLYQAWTYDILRQYGDSKAVQQALLDRVQIGKNYDCWYDPKDPQKVVLVRGYNFYSVGFMIIAVVTALTLLFSILFSF